MKECSTEGGSGHIDPLDVHVHTRCSLFRDRSDKLRQTVIANQRTVNIASPNARGTGFKTVCFYNVSLNNCSSAILRHVTDHPVDDYLDGHGNDNLPCGDYLRLYYGEGNLQTDTFCRDGLATLGKSIPLDGGSFFAVYWADNSGSRTGSFEVNAECAEEL